MTAHHSHSPNETIFQAFEWYTEGTTHTTATDSSGILRDNSISHWSHLTNLLPNLSSLGITSLWIPPGCKGTNPDDNGYGVYDLYDLGEFNTKGSVGTKWGTKRELQKLCATAKDLGIGVLFDAVLNHKAAPDGSEEVDAVKVNPKNRSKDVDVKAKTIEAWTKFEFQERNGKYSGMKYRAEHFSGVDWDSNRSEKAIFKFVGNRPDGTKKGWAQDVAKGENGNYDFLMFADVDFGHAEVREDVKRWGRWLIDEVPGITGFRLDAIKHYSAAFQREFIEYLQEYGRSKGKDIYFVGEYWLPNSKGLSTHIDKTFAGKLNVFDVKLMYNFHDVSNGRLRDLRKVFSGSLVELQPQRAVTFVTNHDTQESQSLAAPIQPWFIPHAYALILLRAEGQPCVFWGDIFGTDGPQPRLPACGGRLTRLVKARQLFSYGKQTDYFASSLKLSSRQDAECIAWSRTWHDSSKRPLGLVAVCSISWTWRKRRVRLGKEYAGQVWTDVMGWAWSGVLIDKDGHGDFPVGPRTISIWTWKDAPGRSEVDALIYPEEPPVEVLATDESDSARTVASDDSPRQEHRRKSDL